MFCRDIPMIYCKNGKISGSTTFIIKMLQKAEKKYYECVRETRPMRGLQFFEVYPAHQ